MISSGSEMGCDHLVKVITYGTYDLLHYGHIRLLERAKALGDYLIVGVTSDDYDKSRGKINVQQSLMQRIENVRSTGLADEIIVEEYEGQKIDDIKKYGIDIFTVGSDWKGIFDYLNEYCNVVYLDRTQGISSSDLRKKQRALDLGLVGNSRFLEKVASQVKMVNGINLSGICTDSPEDIGREVMNIPFVTRDYDELLTKCDAVYVHSTPKEHYEQIEKALRAGKHVLCEAPIAMSGEQWDNLQKLAEENGVRLMDALRTAYSMAYRRLILMVKGGKIGNVVSVDATCTSLKDLNTDDIQRKWNSICDWGPTALLPVFQLLGTDYTEKSIVSHFVGENKDFDAFTKISFVYTNAVASLKVGKGVKSEGDLVISGTKGYVYVPAPWWKTDYFEVRYEDPLENKRYFYQLDGEGICMELAVFARSITQSQSLYAVEPDVSKAICEIINDFNERKGVRII